MEMLLISTFGVVALLAPVALFFLIKPRKEHIPEMPERKSYTACDFTKRVDSFMSALSNKKD